MHLEFAYQVVKDLIALSKMEETDPIDPGTLEMKELVSMGIVSDADPNNYSWIAPRRLFAVAESPTATHEIVWVTDKLRRTKRKIVRFTHSGQLDLILVRKKADI